MMLKYKKNPNITQQVYGLSPIIKVNNFKILNMYTNMKIIRYFFSGKTTYS